jgi:hypothetical protein
MMSFTREAISVAENFARKCNEIQILHASDSFSEKLLQNASGYTQITELYTGDSDKVTLLIEQEIFDYITASKTLKSKLKNTYVPWRNTVENGKITIYAVGR